MPPLFNDLFQEVVEGTLTHDQAELYLDASEKVRRFLNDYLNLKFPLYYHYTHLVCRTALDGKAKWNRFDTHCKSRVGMSVAGGGGGGGLT